MRAAAARASEELTGSCSITVRLRVPERASTLPLPRADPRCTGPRAKWTALRRGSCVSDTLKGRLVCPA